MPCTAKARNSNRRAKTWTRIAKFAGIQTFGEPPDYDRDFYQPVMEALFRSEAWMAIVMITDLLARQDRFNVPGTAADSNWSRRLQLTVARLGASRSREASDEIGAGVDGEDGEGLATD